MPQPTKAQIRRKMLERYGTVANTKTGGSKNRMRRRKFRGSGRTANDFEKRLQSSLQKLGCSTIPGIDEVNLFKDDGTVLHFTKPKVDAEVQSNTFIVSGQFTHSKVEELLPGILPQMGVESLAKLKDYASSLEALNPKYTEPEDDDDDVPMLVDEDMNFEEVAASDANVNKTQPPSEIKENEDSKNEEMDEKLYPIVDESIFAGCKCEPLTKNLSIFNNNEKHAIQLLLQCNQTSMFNEWPDPGIDDIQKRQLLAQVLRLDTQYAPGLQNYYATGKKLISASFEGVNQFSDWVPSIPDGVRLQFNSPEFHEFEALGKMQYPYLGFVLVAGGLGERLGYHGLKISLPIDITSKQCFIEYYIQFILAMQTEANLNAQKSNNNSNSNSDNNEDNNNQQDIVLPLAIMTSGDTHERTVQLLKENSNFGMAENQITIVKQELVPTFANNECEFGRISKYQLGEKPHGHGDVHALLHKFRVVNTWSELYSTKWLIFFQDTNGVVFRSLPSSIGVSAKHNFAMNSISVPRAPGEAIGGITKLTSISNPEKTITVNVEYNQLQPLLLSTGDMKGDVADEDTGFSVYPGNCNTFIIRVDTYLKTMDASQGVIPEFVNPKYTDDTRSVFNKPTRLECMMQEYPKLLDSSENVGITCLPKWLAFMPVKANIADSIQQISKIGVAFSASAGEAAMYFINRSICRAFQTDSCAEIERVFAGISVAYGARIVFLPSFGTTVADIQAKLNGNISISNESSLILEGSGIVINGLQLNGTLIVRALNGSSIVINDLEVDNNGWDFLDVNTEDEAIEEKYRIRGYLLQESEAQVIEFDDGEEHIIDGTTAASIED
jgi:UDP-sugar pyrophosphorylase